MSGSRRSSAGNWRAKQRLVGQPGEAVLRRRARHRDRTLGQRIEAVALEVIGRNDRLLVADDDAQPKVVALGALQFLDGAVAHLDRKRDRTHGERVGLIGAGAARGGHETFGEIGEVGLVEKRRHLTGRFMRGQGKHKAKMCPQAALFNPADIGAMPTGKHDELRRVAATARQSCDAFGGCDTTS